MPLGEGWFLDVESREEIPIHEHSTAVVDDPARFRLSRDGLAGLCPVNPEHRIAILRLALAQGFVRVRAHKEAIVFEFDHADGQRVFEQILAFLRRHEFGPLTVVNLHDLRNPTNDLRACLCDLPHVAARFHR